MADRCRFPTFTTEKTRPFSSQAMRATGRCRVLTSNVPVPTLAQIGRRSSAQRACITFTIPPHTDSWSPPRSFTNNKIPSGEISSVATYFDKLIPSPNSAKRADLHFQSSPVFSLRQFHAARGSSDPQQPIGSLPGTAQIVTGRTTLLRFRLWDPHFLKAPPPTSRYPLPVRFGPHIVNEALYNELPGQYRGFALFNGQGVAMDQAAGIVLFHAGGAHQSRSRDLPDF